MTLSSSPMSDLTAASDTTKSVVFASLPDYSFSGQRCASHIAQQIDLLLLAIEALELGASESMLETVKNYGLQDIIKNRLTLWRLRCTNPLRRAYTRSPLSLDQAKALVLIISDRARQMTVPLRQLLLAEQQMRDRDLPVGVHFLIAGYLDQFRSHFYSRMNPRRARVALYAIAEDELNELAFSLLKKLLYCTGTAGMQRLWISLFDGEVA